MSTKVTKKARTGKRLSRKIISNNDVVCKAVEKEAEVVARRDQLVTQA